MIRSLSGRTGFRLLSFLTALLFFQMAVVTPSWSSFVDAAGDRPSRSSQDLNRIQRTLERKQVRSRLEDLGYTPDEVRQRLERLDDEQLQRLVNRIDTLKAGGGAGEVILAVALVFILLWILDHEGYVDIFR